MKIFSMIALALMSGVPVSAEQSPYKGEEHRSIKSLSPEEIQALRSGEGMGFAKLAELNHYPGPRHVLELADDLDLTPTQAAETRSLYEEMRHRAAALGEELVEAEMRLDRSFARGAISAADLESALMNIGSLRARLRYVHLEAHLRQQRLLSAAQIEKYSAIRGYSHADHGNGAHAKSHK